MSERNRGAESTIIKLGGSLLTLPDVPERLLALIDRLRLPHLVVLPGGGEAAELVRTWDRRYALTDNAAHCLAIEAMSLNAELLAKLNDRFVLIGSLLEWKAFRQRATSDVGILNAVQLLRELEQTHSSLPMSWDVTSDSIAAWIAAHCDLRSMLLLKSTDLPADLVEDNNRASIADQLALRGLVDAHFPALAAHVPQLNWCNLRTDDSPVIRVW